jgi:hypothetical protein
MPQSNKVGIATGLIFVAVFLLMLVTFGQVAKVVQAPFAQPQIDGFDLAGSSRPVTLDNNDQESSPNGLDTDP